jgi:hypothetical protein
MIGVAWLHADDQSLYLWRRLDISDGSLEGLQADFWSPTNVRSSSRRIKLERNFDGKIIFRKQIIESY